jgi:type IV pilus assembly protein PilA
MRAAQPLRRKSFNLRRCMTVVTIGLLTATLCKAQKEKSTVPAGSRQAPEMPWAQDLNKYPGLPSEFSHLLEKLQKNVSLPPSRMESRLMSQLPATTVFVAAIPNYGETATDARKIFHEELQESAVLRDWWTQGQMATDGPKFEDALGKFSEFNKFLGDEIILSATMVGQQPEFFLVAEVRKPGLRQFLESSAKTVSGNSPLHVVDPQELITAKDKVSTQGLHILVRPDLLIVAKDFDVLRDLNAQLDGAHREFAVTPFGKRLLQEYRGGITVMASADVRKVVEKSSPDSKNSVAFEHSGFADLQYITWDHTTLAGVPVSQTVLNFTGPRHGAAAWLAEPREIQGPLFASPDAVLVASLVLANPAQILDDLKEMGGPAQAKTFAAIPQFEQALHLKLKDDLLDLLGGEITFELDTPVAGKPAWRAMIAVKDSNHLQITLTTLAVVAHAEMHEITDHGVTYHTVRIPSDQDGKEYAYTFLNGYMILGPDRGSVAHALELRQSGNSLAKSSKFLNSFPPEPSLVASALFYQDSLAAGLLRLRTLMPGVANSPAHTADQGPGTGMYIYGAESSIREVSNNASLDAAGVLIGAAIAIPNLMRSKVATNEAGAIGSVRTLNTAQVTYAAAFPQRGYAPDMASLGPNPHDTTSYSAEHAGLVSPLLGNPSCIGDEWCTRSGFRFRISTACKTNPCRDYLVVATPISPSTGTRSFCSTADSIVRVKPGASLDLPVSLAECKRWPPLK